MRLRISLLIGAIFVATTNISYAILPPDVIFSVGSQLASFFSVIALLLSSAVAALTNTWQMLYGPITHKKTFWGVVIVSIIFISYAGAQFFETKQKADLYDSLQAGGVSVPSENKEFYSNRFVVFGYDDTKTPFLLEIDANRRQEQSGLFTHYSFNDILHGGVYTSYLQSEETEGVLKSNAFLYDIDHSRFTDLSTRESYTLNISASQDDYEIDITDLEGDFVVKDQPEFTKLYSVGGATVTGRDVSFTAYAAVTSTYSTDFSKYIFFDGYDDLVADAFQFTLWDGLGNFYLFDQTTVLSDFNPSYTSHNWGLYKSADGAMKRAFDIVITQENDDMTSWTITAPSFDDATVTLLVDTHFKDTTEAGLVSGIITDAKNGERVISGLGHYRHISP